MIWKGDVNFADRREGFESLAVLHLCGMILIDFLNFSMILRLNSNLEEPVLATVHSVGVGAPVAAVVAKWVK